MRTRSSVTRVRRSLLLPLASAIATCTVLTACDSTGRPTPVNGALILVTEIDASVVPPGGSTIIRSHLRNMSDRTVSFSFTGCTILTNISRRPGGEEVLGPVRPCTTVITPVTLGPGQARTEEFPVRSQSSQELGYALTAGDYDAYATIDTPEYDLRSPNVPFTVR
jgi:hypothetical protein